MQVLVEINQIWIMPGENYCPGKAALIFSTIADVLLAVLIFDACTPVHLNSN